MEFVSTCQMSVVSRRGRNHSLLAFFPAQSQQLVQGSPFLERAGPLQVVEFQVNGIAGQLGKRRRVGAGREIDRLANAIVGGLDVGERDHLLHSTRNISNTLTREVVPSEVFALFGG